VFLRKRGGRPHKAPGGFRGIKLTLSGGKRKSLEGERSSEGGGKEWGATIPTGVRLLEKKNEMN